MKPNSTLKVIGGSIQFLTVDSSEDLNELSVETTNSSVYDFVVKHVGKEAVYSRKYLGGTLVTTGLLQKPRRVFLGPEVRVTFEIVL